MTLTFDRPVKGFKVNTSFSVGVSSVEYRMLGIRIL